MNENVNIEFIMSDGSKITTSNYFVNGQWIYFEKKEKLKEQKVGKSNIYRMKLDGTNLEILAEGSLQLFNKNESKR
ncbi:DUF5050 domain-containing protein [Evansella halocellulosilytica]|uniref:DUF5050 domain-containing protein n=1 Tax=Evansella halocellulosilytica TaxID=2011013 RepID=UPI00211D04F2|nr:DUF5050 domain-containing protein [Evansella halocellulosilytica]